MKASITYAALSLFLILCACAVPALAFQGPYADAQRLGSVGVPAGLAVVLWVLRDARATLARWRVEGELHRAEKEREARRNRRAKLAALKAEREALGSKCWWSDSGTRIRNKVITRLDELAFRISVLEGQIAADEVREKMEAQP